MSANAGKRRTPSWEEIAQMSKYYGWSPESVGKEKIILERGRQRILAKRVPNSNMWKVEYFSGSIMDDTTGVESERAAKIDAVEMSVLK